MDMQTPDIDTTTRDPGSPVSRIFHKRLMKTLSATMPAGGSDDPEAWAENWDTTRELYESLGPRDPAEAALAAFGVAAFHSAMDNFARAARPGTSDDKAARLRGGALAAGRAYAAAMRHLRRQHAAATPNAAKRAAPKPAAARAEPPPPPSPKAKDFQPRDRFGNPIKDWRWQDMTMAQRRATYASPPNPELEAIAVAEEEAMIAEQAALGEAGSTAADGPAGSG